MFNFHYRLERNAIGFVLAIIVVASIGGFIEIAPLFTIDETVEKAPDMRVYTPLEVAGRNIYIREGCYACHSQMIRTLRDEVETLRSLFTGGGVEIRSSDAVGLEADGTRSCPRRAGNIPTTGMSLTSTTRVMWFRNPTCPPIAGCCATS